MRQYEADTWYDANGRIVFTASKGLPGVGLPRKAVREIPPTPSTPRPPGHQHRARLGRHPEPRIRHDPPPRHGQHPSRRPGQRRIEYVAPFTRPDREQDYRDVWDAFKYRDTAT